jgi:glycerol kinase
LSTIAWVLDQKATYAIEGSVFIGGAIVQWLRDKLRVITKSSDTEAIARETPNNGGVFFVPALAGLGAPYWDMYARGMIIGITRSTGKEHIIRAALEAICQQSADVIERMSQSGRAEIKCLAVDGGASENNFLMQLQADLLGLPVERPLILETSALGAAFLAGLSSGVWSDFGELRHLRKVERVFAPRMPKAERVQLRFDWKRAVDRARDWANPAFTPRS